MKKLLKNISKVEAERRRKISENNAKYWLGTKGSRFGQKHRDDTKEKIAESLRKWRERLQKDPVAFLNWVTRQKQAHTGKKHSISTRRKMSRACRIRYGTLRKRKTRRDTLKYFIWKERVIKRDGRICSICKATGKEAHLEVDHINPWALFPKLRYDPKNGRVVCRHCHLKYGWRGSHVKS